LAFGRVSFSDPVKVPPGFVSWGKAAWNGPLGFGRGFHTIESDLLAAVFFLAVMGGLLKSWLGWHCQRTWNTKTRCFWGGQELAFEIKENSNPILMN